MTSFIPTTRRHPCPVCANTSGKCRSFKESPLVLCGTIHESIPGWKYLGDAQNPLWAKMLPVDANEDLNWQHPPLDRNTQAQEPRKPELSAAQWNHHYRALQAQKELNPDDRADLTRRLEQAGLNAETYLPQLGARSVQISDQTGNLNRGYVIPFPDVNGYLVGSQVRLNQTDGGRYRWYSPLSNVPKQIQGEMPLAVWRPGTIAHEKEAVLTEGTGIKPFIAAEKLGRVTIGASGANHAVGHLATTLSHLNVTHVSIAVDAGAVLNSQVLRQYQRTQAVCESLDLTVRFLWWGQVSKEKSDIDEIADCSEIKRLSPEEFWSIAREHCPTFKVQLDGQGASIRIGKKRLSLAELQRLQQGGDAQHLADTRKEERRQAFFAQVEAEQRTLNSLNLEPDVVVTDRYLPGGELHEPGIYVVDAPMGTGKTSSYLKGMVDRHRQMPKRGKVIGIGSRNTLLLQTAQVLGLKHHSQYADHHEACRGESWLGCYDSLWQLRPDKDIPEATLLLLDEPEQGFKHLLFGDTLKQMQPFLIERFRAIVQHVISGGGWIVLSEDGITNLGIEFMQDLVGKAVPIHFTQSTYQSSIKRKIKLYDSPTATWTDIYLKMGLDRHDSTPTPLIASSDSAKWLRETERMLMEHGVDSDRIWILDAESVQKPWARAFAQNPDRWIEANKPLFLGYSPSLQSGTSITIPYFSEMAIHLVHLEPREAKQLPGRYRPLVPLFGYVKERAMVADSQGGSYQAAQVLQNLYQNTEGLARLTQIAGFVQQQSDSELNLLETLTALRDPTNDRYTFWLKHWAKLKARENWGKSHLKEHLIEIWEDQGHQVTRLTNSKESHWSEERTRIRTELNLKDAQNLAALDCNSLSLNEAHDILNRLGTTQEDRKRAYKRLIQEQLPGLEQEFDDPAFLLKVVIENNGQFLHRNELLWAILHPQEAAMVDRGRLFKQLKRSTERDEMVWLPHLQNRSLKANLIARSPLTQHIKQDVLKQAYDRETPWVQEVHEWAVWNAQELYRVLRLQVKPEHSPMQTVNKLLRRLGYEPVRQQAKRPNGRNGPVLWSYQIVNLEDVDRNKVLNALSEHFKRTEEKWSDQRDRNSSYIDPSGSYDRTTSTITGTAPVQYKDVPPPSAGEHPARLNHRENSDMQLSQEIIWEGENWVISGQQGEMVWLAPASCGCLPLEECIKVPRSWLNSAA